MPHRAENLETGANMRMPTLVEILLSKFDGQLLIPFIEAIQVIGYKEQTARNELHKRIFPVRTVLQRGRRFICVTDLAEYLAGLQSDCQKKSRAGRPTKASKIEARSHSGGAR